MRKYQTEVSELKNIITEVKNTLEVFNSRQDEAAEQINDREDKVVELTQTEQQKKRKEKNAKNRRYPKGASRQHQ